MLTGEKNIVVDQALSFINETGCSIFLTGQAGTGKTSFLRSLANQTFKRMVISAPTGIAAIQAGGVTIHSLFNLPPKPFIPGQDTDNSRLDKARRELLIQLELLVIDEVSMVRADLIDAIDFVLRTVRNSPDLPFGGVQVLFIGDPYQLSPIATDADLAVLQPYYQSLFFADAHVFKKSTPVLLELQTVYRQQDSVFIEILNAVRMGNCRPSTVEKLNLRCTNGRLNGAANFVALTTHNVQTDAINNLCLDRLDGDLYHFRAEVTGGFEEAAFPAEENLKLKIGARIMVLRNDREGRYYNGKSGLVTGIGDEGLVTRFDDGLCVTIGRETWTNIRYEFDPSGGGIQEKEAGSFRQYPVRLAWAMTIHKSQGMTFDAAEIDLSGMFAPGQAYVALSRLRSLEGLTVKAPLSAASLNANAVTPNIPAAWSLTSGIAELLEQEKAIFLRDLLIGLFDWAYLQAFLEEYKDLPGTKVLFDGTRVLLTAHSGVAEKFKLEIQVLFDSGRSDKFEKIAERVAAACAWFIDQMDSRLIPIARDQRQKSTGSITLRKNLPLANGLLIRYERKKKELATAYLIADGVAAGQKISILMAGLRRAASPAKNQVRQIYN